MTKSNRLPCSLCTIEPRAKHRADLTDEQNTWCRMCRKGLGIKGNPRLKVGMRIGDMTVLAKPSTSERATCRCVCGRVETRTRTGLMAALRGSHHPRCTRCKRKSIRQLFGSVGNAQRAALAIEALGGIEAVEAMVASKRDAQMRGAA